MQRQTRELVDGRGLRIGLAVSRYHADITDSMRDAAVEAFKRSGGDERDLTVMPAPGSFELVAICRAMAVALDDHGERAFDAVVAIGCIITGETTHDQYIAQAVTHGLTQIITSTGVPIAFGVLTCQSLEQARARSIDAGMPGGDAGGGSGNMNKGAEAMLAAIQAAQTIRALSNAGLATR